MAAVDCGADAIYIGASMFGARSNAANSVEDIKTLCLYARPFGVKVYATMNTLLYDNEMQQAGELAQELIAAGVDALIVQDMALLRMNLGCEMHASTQTACLDADMAKFLSECGFARVVVERGLSLTQIGQIGATGVEMEAFVHGAICVGYSGLCYLSRTMSERSGNRGECMQACRLTYDLEDEQGQKIIENSHLLSVRDMNLTQDLEALIDVGVRSFKIEGRLKDVGYVRNTVAHYRREIDAIIARRNDLIRSSFGTSRAGFEPDAAKSFTRGFSSYYLHGNGVGVASFDTPKALGESLGKVKRASKNTFEIDGKATLSAGDGICFFVGKELCGTNINSVSVSAITPNSMEGIALGSEIFRNYDHRFTLDMNAARSVRTIPAKAVVTVSAKRIELKVRDMYGAEARKALKGDFEVASNPEKMLENLRTAIQKSGGTIFDITAVKVVGASIPFIPIAQINNLRREVLQQLTDVRAATISKPRIAVESPAAPFPVSMLPVLSATNSLSREFYADHGVADARGLDRSLKLDNEVVMRTPYCIRREIGECLKQPHKLTGKLYIKRGRRRYELCFDCAKCEMNILYEGIGDS